MPIETGQNVDQSDFINESERNTTPANDAGRVLKLESDGYLSPAWLNAPPVTRVYSASDTWSKPAGLKFITVELVGGGGPGVRNGSSSESSSAGGAAGGYSRKIIQAGDLSATEAVTVGEGGVSSASPTQGGTTSFGGHLQATGGTVQAPGVGSGGDVNLRGGQGQPPNDDDNRAAAGGDSYFGGGGLIENSTNSHGNPGMHGGGGGGATSDNNSGNFTEGGEGGDGLVIVTEYYI